MQFQSSTDVGAVCSGEKRLVPISRLCPEDRFRLSKKHPKFNYFGLPSRGSLAAVIDMPELTLCAADEVKVKARSPSDQYKKGNSSISFLVIGAYVAKKNQLTGPTWHVSFIFSAFRNPHAFQVILMMDWERSLTLSEPQLVHQMYTVAAQNLLSFLKQSEPYEHKPNALMDAKKGDIAANVLSVCRTTLASYIATPSLALKAFNAIAVAHSNWDQKNLKPQFVKEIDVGSDDDVSVSSVTSPIKLGTKAPLTTRPQRKRKQAFDFF